MNFNPHYATARALVDDHEGKSWVSPYRMQRAQIEATLALAWEQARAADELCTANMIAALHPVNTGAKECISVATEPALEILNLVKERLYPQGAPKMSSPCDHRCQCCGELGQEGICDECTNNCTAETGKGGVPE